MSGKEKTNTSKPAEILKLEQELGIELKEVNKTDYEQNSTFSLTKQGKVSGLNLNDNKLEKIPDLSSLTSLTTLYLSKNQINKIENLNNLEELYILFLNKNQIKIIEGLASLDQLLLLSLDRNQIEKIEGLNQLKRLRYLYLHNNKIKRIEELESLDQLESLYLNSNQICKIENLNHLIRLEKLELSYNQIEKVEGLNQLKKLQTLDLSHNQIISIQEWDIKTEHPNSETLFINNNPFIEETDLVLKSFENHLQPILNYLSIQKDKEEKKNRMTTLTLPVKMMVLGNHAAGKSTFVSYLQQGKLSSKALKSTHILDIQRYQETGKGIPDIMIYDFGGQDYYHGVYQAFFTLESFNLLLWNQESNRNGIRTCKNGMQTRDFTYEYWLYQLRYAFSIKRTQEIYSSEPVMILQTHADREGEKREVFKGETVLFHIVHDLFISLSPQATKMRKYLRLDLEACREKIWEQIEFKKENREVPQYYSELLQYILNYTRTECIPVSDLLQVYKRKPLKNETKQHILNYLKAELSQLALKGMVLYYPKKDELEEVVWLNPAATIRYIHQAILSRQSMKKYQGVVPEEAFNGICNNAFIRQLLLNEKVIFQDERHPRYIIPGYLPLCEEDDKIHRLMTFGFYQPDFTLKFTTFIPFGLINQLICYYGNESDLKHVWRDQVIFTYDEDIQVWIALDFTHLEIKVSIRPRKPLSNSRLKEIELDFFMDILFLYWGEEPTTIVPSPESLPYIKKILSECYSRLEKDLVEIDVSEILWEKNKSSGEIPEQVDPLPESRITSEEDKEIKAQQEIPEHFFMESKRNHLLNQYPEPPDDLYLSIDDTWFVPYNEMVKESTEQVVAYGRIEGASAVDREVKRIQRTSLYYHFITDKNFKKMKKIFISYSRKDVDFKNELKNHLNMLKLFDIADNWSCEELTIGKWDEQIQQQLQESDLIIFMLSANFFSSKYILEKEVQEAMNQLIQGKKKDILCVIVSDFVQLDKIKAACDEQPQTDLQEAILQLSGYQYFPYGKEINPVTKNTYEVIIPLNRFHPCEQALAQITEKIMEKVKP